MKTIVWLREDLRLENNPALSAAAELGEVVPVFVYPQGLGGASYWWLHHSLRELSSQLLQRGVKLILRTGNAGQILTEIAQQSGAESVFWNRVYSPSGIELGSQVRNLLDEHEISYRSFNAQLLIEPTKVLNKQGAPFKVFTPFWRHCRSNIEPQQLLAVPEFEPSSLAIESESFGTMGVAPH